MEPHVQEWIYKASDGVEYGPYTTSEVRRYAAEGRILPSGSLRRPRRLRLCRSGWRARGPGCCHTECRPQQGSAGTVPAPGGRRGREA